MRRARSRGNGCAWRVISSDLKLTGSSRFCVTRLTQLNQFCPFDVNGCGRRKSRKQKISFPAQARGSPSAKSQDRQASASQKF
jgi:hypothetical protein